MSLRPLVLSVSALLLLSGCKEKEDKASAAIHLKAAKDLLAQHDYSHALVEAKTAIKGDPLNGDTHFVAAQIMEAQGDLKEAFPEYARAALPESNNLPAQIRVIQILISANQLDSALGRVNGTLGSRPNDPDVLALRAVIEQRQGKADKAHLDAQAALLKAPGQPTASGILATEALQEKNPDKALTFIEQGLKKNPGNIQLTQIKASALLMQGDRPGATALYEDLVKRDPANGKLRIDLAELYASSGDVDKGEQLLHDGLKSNPDDRQVEVGLMGYLGRHRNAAALEAELRAAVARTPKESFYDLLLAEQLLRAGRIVEAQDVLKAAIGRVPEGPARSGPQVALARIDVTQGDLLEAKTILDTAIAAKADNDEALLLRGDLAVQTDDPARAIPDLLSVASRQPNQATPLRVLAEAYLKQGDTDKALDAMKKAVYFEPTNLALSTRLAEIEVQAKQPDAAKLVIADFNKRSPNSIEGLALAVRFAVQRKDWAGAGAAIEKIRGLPNSDKIVPQFQAELLEARGQPAQAVPIYQRLIDTDDLTHLNQNAVVGLVRATVAAKQPDDAVTFLSPLADKAKGDVAAYLNLALASLLRTQDKSDQANAALDAAIKADPTQPAGYLERSAILLRSNQKDQAVAAINDGLWAGAAREPLLMARATLEEQSGNKDAAISTYQDVLKIDPRSVVAANNFASLVADAKPTDKALLKSARAPIGKLAGTSNPALLDTIAWLDYRLGDLQSAKDLLVRAKADTSNNAQIRFHYGAVLMAMGDKDAGRTILKATLASAYPGRDEAERLVTE